MSHLSHGSPLHLVLNVFGLFALGAALELEQGSAAASGLIALFWTVRASFLKRCTVPVYVCVSLCGLASPRSLQLSVTINISLAFALHREQEHSVGISGVIFAILSYSSVRRFMEGGDWQTLIAPLVSLAVAQVILPNVSWLGHVSGLVSGAICSVLPQLPPWICAR